MAAGIRFAVLILVSVTLFLSSPAPADLQLTFNEIKSSEKPPTDAAIPTRTEARIVLLLGEDYCLYRNGSHEDIYDFGSKRILSIDRSENSYSSMSLFAMVGFRELEIRNRVFLSETLRKAGTEDGLHSVAFGEHELSIRSKSSKTKIQRKEIGDAVVFLESGYEILSIANSRFEIPESYTKPFVRCFRHRFSGHPSIIGKIVSPAGIAKRIAVSHPNNGTATELTLVSANTVPPAVYSLKGLKETNQADSKLMALVARAKESPTENRRLIAGQLLADSRSAVADGKYLDGMVGYLALGLLTGSREMPRLGAESDKLFGSTDGKGLLAASANPSNRKQAEASIEALQLYREEVEIGTYVLKVFEANTSDRIGERRKAMALMLEALAENPYLAGAWKDLGGFYYWEYSPLEAWICWDTARSIHPDHPLMEALDDFEHKLQIDFPNLF